ncbi:hypothetical protein [uncultured Aquimarina sp.]|uniref:hypothetical protein n=1 Tax=uncultured Aquimarina sp. TaxID=575652 RepID=UPI00262520CC|nr:hypothetical protein [uncultured Aquimarina sp.]
MKDTENDNIKNIEFLVTKSRELLQEQLKSYETATNKAGILISISGLFLPIAIAFISSSDTVIILKIITLIPVIIMIIGLIYLLKVLMPKGLDHGFDFNQFNNKINENYKQLLLYEIGANKSSFQDNSSIVLKQNKDFKIGLKFIFSATIFVFLIVTASLFMNDQKLDTEQTENIKIEQINNIEMADKKSENDSTSSNENQNNSESTIPEVPREQRANIEKGDDPKKLDKK